jgi:hypothetical protein
MKKNQTTKTFDCIAMKRAAQKVIRAKVQGMTRDEEIAFFRTGREEFDQRLQKVKQSRKARGTKR